MDRVFGFFSMFGFVCSGSADGGELHGYKRCWICSGFGGNGGAEGCSVCSVDFVEKLCKSMWASLWEKRGKVFQKLWESEFCTYLRINMHSLWINVERFASGFAHGFFPVMSGFCTFSTDPTTTTINILGERTFNGN